MENDRYSKLLFFQSTFDFNFRFNRKTPPDCLHVNRVVVSQTFRPKLVSPEVLDQEQFACIISCIFLIFLKHNPPINFSKIISCSEKQFYNISLVLSFVFMLRDQ